MSSEIEAVVLDSAGEAYRPRHGHTRPPGSPCANCGAILAGAWCHDCGQLAEDFHRSIVRLVGEVVEGLTHLDGRFWRTAPALALKPAKLTRDYIDGHRAAQIPPLRLFLVVLLVFFLVASASGGGKTLQFGTPSDRERAATSVEKVDLGVVVGDKRILGLESWFKPRIVAVLRDPERFKLILESQEERFAVLALPVATCLLAMLFVFQRRFYIFDHTIFALHSLSLQGMLLSLSSVLGLAIGGTSGLLLFFSPVHLFIHMRGVYRTSVVGTLLRMVALAIGSLVAFVVLFLVLLLVGLSAMS